MKLIESKAELLPWEPGIEGVYKAIERAGRNCYKSEDKITEDSAKGFVDRMIASKHCYTGESEVLTEHGWVKWKEYNGQKVAVVNTDLSFKGFEVPQNVLHHTYTGKFYEYPTLGIKVTDGHRMFGVFRLGDNNFYNNNNYNLFICNSKFVDNNGRHKTNGERMFKTPRHCIKPLSTNPYMELIGFWLGDGCHLKETKNKLVFHLKKQRKIEYLRNIANRLGWVLTEGKNNYYRIEHENIGDIFNKLYYSEGKVINTIPNSAEAIHSVIIGLLNSDGSQGINTKTITYTSTSKSIIDWICNYAPLAGYTVSYRGVCDKNNRNHNITYKVLLLTTDYTICNDSRYTKSKTIIAEKTEDVYCVTVSTGLIMVRGTNGITTICGNCAMLEHGSVYLKWYSPGIYDRVKGHTVYDYVHNPYTKSFEYLTKDSIIQEAMEYRITTNYRVLIENNWLDDLQYMCDPTEYHELRYSFKFTCSRAIANELVRHRTFSFAQQSQRYCNYSKDKFGKEITFIAPTSFPNMLTEYQNHFPHNLAQSEIAFLEHLRFSEHYYMHLLKDGWTPQQARDVLPNATKTEIVMTGFASDWRYLFDLRLFGKTGAPHPDMVDLMGKAKAEAEKNGIWDDIMSYPSKFES